MFRMVSKQEIGQWFFSLPVPSGAYLTWTDAITSVEPFVKAVFANPREYADLTIPVVNETNAAGPALSQVTGFNASCLSSE